MSKKEKDEYIEFEDQTNDRKYFTIVPNIVMKKCTPNEQLLYLHIKQASGEHGVCFVSDRTMKDRLKIGHVKLKEAYDALVAKGFVLFKGTVKRKTKGGEQSVGSYAIIDVWGSNFSHSSGGAVQKHPRKKVLPASNQGAPVQQPNKITLKRSQKDVAEKSATPLPEEMDQNQFVDWCRKSPLRHINIIAEYADEKKLAFKTKDQWREFIKRNVRPAKQLSSYDDDQIAQAMEKLEQNKQGEGHSRGYITQWTLETVIKFLDQ